MKGPIARATIRTSVVLGLRLLVQAGTLLIVARLLGPQKFGAFAGLAALAVVLGTLSTFGTHLMLLESVSRSPEQRSAVLRFAIPTTLLCGGGLLLLYLLTTLIFFGGSGVNISALVLLGTAELLLQPLLNLSRMERLGREHTARSELFAVLPLALRLTAAIIVWFFHADNALFAYAWGYLAASSIALLTAISPRGYRWTSPAIWRLPKRNELQYGASFALMNLTGSGPGELDKILALKLLPLGAVGVYAASTRVIAAFVLPVVAMMLAALPRLYRDGYTDQHRSRRLLRWTFGVALAYGLMLGLMMWLAAPLFDWVFGAKYHGIGDAIRWLCPMVPGMALRIVSGAALMSTGRVWARVFFEVSGLIILVCAALAFTQKYQTAGMILALTCSEWFMGILGMVCVKYARTAAYKTDQIN